MSTNAASTLVLGGHVFLAEVHRSTHDPRWDTLFLTGQRGGRYFLRRVRGDDTGLFEVASEAKGGEMLRDASGRPVCVWWVGDIVEEVSGRHSPDRTAQVKRRVNGWSVERVGDMWHVGHPSRPTRSLFADLADARKWIAAQEWELS